MMTVRFWKQTAERAVKSFAQGVIATWLGVGQVMGVDEVASLFTLKPWAGGLATAVLSVLTSMASSRVGDDGDPSLL